MLLGRFGDTSGRPFFEGHVFLPRLEKRGNISFLFDTGADTSLMMPVDGRRIGVDYNDLGEMEETLGVGGLSETFVEPAYIAFIGDGKLYGYQIELRICKPSEALATVPSLLGRDIIDKWRVIYNNPEMELSAEVVMAEAVVDHVG